MNRTHAAPPAPPRLLLGVALLFWGGVSGHPVVGLVCAFLVEARAWTDLRWNFGERGFVRAWALSLLLTTLALASLWLQGKSVILLFDLLVWIPVLFLPVVLSQCYATQPSMPLNTFSFIARRKMLIDRAAGRPVDPIQVHIGYPYLCLILVASALGVPGPVYFLGLFALMAVGLFCISPFGKKRPISWSVALVLVAVLGAGASFGLFALFEFLGGVVNPASGRFTSTDRARTAIGQLGRIKQSYRVHWRVNDPEPRRKRLFREAAYNHHELGQWWHKPIDDPKESGTSGNVGGKPRGSLKRDDDYEDMWDRELPGGGRQFAFEPAELDRDPRQRRRMQLVGQVRTISPLPLPDSTHSLSRLQAEGVQYNSLGTVRLENPEHSVVSFDVFYGGPSLHEKGPNQKFDLQVPAGEKPGMARYCDALDLRGRPAGEVLPRIRQVFLQDFEYSIHLDDRHHTGPKYQQAVSRFLENSRVGHCEYFATAAVLLLREAGIPARYCVGFSAQEQSESGTWLLRGRHAHAWCRVYVGGERRVEFDQRKKKNRMSWTGGKWIDFDPTPPDWLAIEGSGIPWQRRLLDWWQRVREDFLLWRTTPGNSVVVSRVMGIVGILLLAYVSFRLWQSRTRHGRKRRGMRGAGKGDALVTPLHGLAKPAEHWLGSRREGEAFTEWILRLSERLPSVASTLQRAVSFHWKARFDPIGLDPHEEGEFERVCRDLKCRLKEYRRRG